MAYTKILVIHNRLDKSLDYALDGEKTSASLAAAIDYAFNIDKTETSCMETAINCGRETAYADMMATKRRWGKAGGGRVKGYHIIQSFAPGEVTPEQAHAAGVEFASKLLADRYEVIVSTHLNKAHYHNHVVINSVSFMDGKMYRNNFRDYFGGDGVGIRGTSDAVCQAHGLSVIKPGERRQGRQYSEWEAQKSGKPTIRGIVRQDIDAILNQSYTYKTFLQELRRQGYEIKSGLNIKHTAVRPPGGQKYIRLDSLGAGYTEAEIKARLTAIRSGEAPPPSPESPPPSPWLAPGRRYQVRGGVPRHRPRKLTGFRALYFKYLYLLGAIPQRRPRNRAAFLLREELLKFDRYQEQFRYLMKNRIETAAQLAMQYDALQAEIDALTDRRAELYRLRRSGRGGGAADDEITAITTHLRGLRRELKLCARIEGDIPRIREGVAARPPDRKRSKTHEKADKGGPDRHPGTDPGLPAGDAQEH